MIRRWYVAGDRVRLVWGGLPGDDQGTWQVREDEFKCGGLCLRRTDRVAGGLQIMSNRVELVATAEEELARELMG